MIRLLCGESRAFIGFFFSGHILMALISGWENFLSKIVGWKEKMSNQ